MSETRVAILPDAVAPFSLYLDLESGKLVNLEVVARIALSLGEAIREAAFILDPSIEIRIELLSGTEGSFSLNTFIRSINLQDYISRKRLIAIALMCGAWFLTNTAVYTYDKVLDHLMDSPQYAVLSAQDKQDIANLVIDGLSKKVALDKVQTIYRSVQADKAIKGVGASQTHGERPTQIVPRSEFATRAGAQHEAELQITNRTRENEETLTLISPVLLEDSPRRWRVRGPGGEFGASVKDEAFLRSLTHGHAQVQMVSDIQLVVILETKEALKDGIWEIKERNILRVIRVIEPPKQGNFSIDGTSPGPEPGSN